MKISLIHPSRGRARKAQDTAINWIGRTDVDVEHIFSIDSDDPEKEFYKPVDKLVEGDNKSVVEATNKAAALSTGDILIYLSDDFDCPENWGELVLEQFKDENRPLLLKVDDCLQHFEVPVLTIPIMNRSLYDRLGYFWHPEYKSMFVDEDLYWTCRKLGALKSAPNLKFEHKHPCVGKAENDETYRRSSANWEQGKSVFLRRKDLGFPI